MDKRFDAKKIEEEIYSFWEKGDFFKPENSRKEKEPFSVVIPPPNVTGVLHMGHALNSLLQDIIIRKKRMEGYETVWVPGTDHAGIATQNVVEKKLKKEGKTRFDLGREKFLEKVWEWKEEYGNLILNQFKKLGVSCDWSRTRFTMDAKYTKAVKKAFNLYWKRGWIYRGERAVNWCKRCRTSLSELELEYSEEKGTLFYIKYPLTEPRRKGEFITVATTRPETMLGDTAVAINPDDKKHKGLTGKSVILPIVGREIPIISDLAVESKFGTGAVKVTPFHSVADFSVAQKHNIEGKRVINEEGKMAGEIPEELTGLDAGVAREEILKILEKENLLEKKEEITHKIPHCYRCGEKVEIIPSNQWFVKMDELSKIAAEPVRQGEIKFFPERWKKPYLDWLSGAYDWCISRQIWWGHKLPVWFCQNEKDKFFVSLESHPQKCEICGKCEAKQSEDVFDTWFSSAIWPFAVFGWPEKTEDLEKFFPVNVLSTARDIINLWVVRMIFSARAFLGKNPFSKIIIHPTIVTKKGERMSKSKGTGIDPLNLVENYGADATRFGLAWQATESQDIRFSEDDISAGRKFATKIWNATRFVLLTIGDDKRKIREEEMLSGKMSDSLTDNDKDIVRKLNRTIMSVSQDLENFQFAKAAKSIYHFFWGEFCDKYIETAKKQIEENEERAERTKEVLLVVLLNSLKLLHPFIPFITEKIYSFLSVAGKEKALIISNWPEVKK